MKLLLICYVMLSCSYVTFCIYSICYVMIIDCKVIICWITYVLVKTAKSTTGRSSIRWKWLCNKKKKKKKKKRAMKIGLFVYTIAIADLCFLSAQVFGIILV